MPMQNAIVIGGRLVGPRNVQLDEPVADLHAEVKVIVRSSATANTSARNLSEFMEGLPPGTRSRGDIDGQLRSERAEWEKGE